MYRVLVFEPTLEQYNNNNNNNSKESDSNSDKEEEMSKKNRQKENQKNLIPSTIDFQTGNPSIEAQIGKLHLYRNRKPGPENNKPAVALVAIGIPSVITISDFCKFIGGFVKQVKQIKVFLTSPESNRYHLLLEFEDEKVLDQFYSEFNNKKYNSFLENETCILAPVSKIDYAIRRQKPSTPNVLTPSTPQTPVPSTEDNNDNNNNNDHQELNSLQKELQSQQYDEVPTCPVCLERLDSTVTGLITTICNHNFHCNCLIKSKVNSHQTKCPVCRLIQEPHLDEGESEQQCFECFTKESLWICLICGNIGCGRYTPGGHARKHFELTNHCFALELETQRVWDYKGDNYVHRVIQDKSNGELLGLQGREEGYGVEGSSNRTRGDGEFWPVSEEEKQVVVESKRSAIEVEYTNLLTSQLETQKRIL